MDRQKTIPPLSTKITRKLAQESADHNTLMNFYSQISRDETGAPKKWKMSSTLHIDEESIKSKKVGIGKGPGSGSNKETPTSSRENSNERKSRINNSLQKSQKSGRKSRDGSSSDQNSSSRESSLENKSDDKKVKKPDTEKKNRSISGDSFRQRKFHTTFSTSSTDTGKKKRGRRPKSLDLSTKTMANGDDDNFKSPDPLTPCNIAVKRKKGRPKETPPVLYAEPPVEPSPVESLIDSDSEYTSPPLKRGPGRPKKIKVFKTDQLKSIGKGEKLKAFNMKRYEGLKQYSSKILKSNLPKGFRRMAKLPKLKPVMLASENSESDISMKSVENEDIGLEIKDKGKLKENGISGEKRRPGRPPGAKNKKYHGPVTTFKTRAKALKPRGKTPFGSQSVKLHRRPGRPPGARNKSTLLRLAEKNETISNSSKENSVVSEKEEIKVPFENETETNDDAHAKPLVNAIDEAIESVVFKARNDISLESNIKPRVPFRSSLFYKKLSSVKSVAKLKKEKDIIHKIRKKRILKAHASDSEFGNQTETLASNDLRRKLHSKLIEKLSNETKIIPTANEVAANANFGVQTSIAKSEKNSMSDESKVKLDTHLVFSSSVAEEMGKHSEASVNIPETKTDEKEILKPDVDKVNDNLKIVRKQSIDMTKFSDTESVCSELSTNSIGSMKRTLERQVLILGEENLDSDDQTVRTRQRFEIIPGKKRKRTLSGEFDLLDEKQLRKEKRKVERVQTDDESEVNHTESVMPVKKPLFKKKKIPMKKSPNLKVKEGKIVKKYVSQLTAYRHRMLKQSPFLSRVRKRRRKTLGNERTDALLDNLNKPKAEVHRMASNDEKTNVGISSGKVVSTQNCVIDPVVMKSESHRKGLFEKFTDVTLQNKVDLVVQTEKGEKNRKYEQDDVDSDDTECTIELRDEILNEDQDDMPIEESVDDSDTIDFHAEEDTESSSKELYTESEIEIREMLFDLIDDVAIKCEAKYKQQNETRDTNNVKDMVEEKVGNGTSQEITDKNKEDNHFKEKLVEKTMEVKLVEETLEANILNENVNVFPSDRQEDYREIIENASEQKAITDKVVSDAKRENAQTSEFVPKVNAVAVNAVAVNKDIQTPIFDNLKSGVEMAEGKSTGTPKFKHKVKKRRFGPKTLSKKESTNIVTEIKVRKKPGRKPKQRSGEDVALNNETDAIQQNKSKTNLSEKSSPETGVTRKFELRQKISRSPLDNIALKQSIEENVYLRNEAQKASRKEAKLKTKAKAAVQDSLESLSLQTKDIETNEKVLAETPTQEMLETQNETEVITETVDDLIKTCKPCKVILKDFIKELERAQEGEESSYESEMEAHERQEHSDSEKGNNLNKPIEAIEVNLGITTSSDIPFDGAVETNIKDIVVEEIYEKTEMQENSTLNVNVKENTALNIESITTEENLQNENNENSAVEFPDSLLHNERTENFGDINDNKKDIETADISQDMKQRELRPKRKTPVKAEDISPSMLAVTPPKKGRKSKSIHEQQTARKTVPPLKIKVKGGFSRRKTYIVEPSPDSPVEHSGKNEHKIDKRKDKNKSKSGNRSESDSEKLNKSHHHHKKRKTPTEEVNEQSKTSISQAIETSGSTVNVLSEKAAIRATDAYEATFLQFIQDKDKVEQNLAAFSSSLGPRNKHSFHNTQKTLHKDSKINNMTSTSTSLAVNVAKVAEENLSVPVTSDSQNDIENSEVQYMCSQCDNVVYKAQEQIIQHYRDVHPGSQFIYKALPDTPENVTPANDPGLSTAHSEQIVDNSTDIENTKQASLEENDQSQVDDDDDSGSLNLKIVDVVSLKDQPHIHEDETDLSKEENNATVNLMQTNQMQTELRVPSYPIPASAPPPYPVKCGPPPPYSVATAVTPLQVSSGIQELANSKPQIVPVKPRSQVQSGKICNSFKCEKCNVHAPMLAAMVAHLRNSHREIPRLFQCPYCKDMEAESEAMIHLHIKKYHPTNNPNPPVALSEPAKRNLKTLSVRLPEGIKLGEGNNIEKDIYMCLKCKEHVPSLETIYEHLEHEHVEVFAYVCPVCKVFKSKTEDLVNNHIIMEHRRSPVDVNVSLAIDGNHFVRVQCLIKDKTKSSQKAVQSASLKPQISPVPNVMEISKPTIQGQAITNVLQLKPIQQVVIPQDTSVPVEGSNTTHPINVLQHQIGLNVSAPSVLGKTAAPPIQKKKKSLLESIQKIKDQKMEQQGLLPQKTGSSAAQIPSHPSQLGSLKPNSTLGGVPPPLMRGPPPLIRYDQLNKVTSAHTAMFGSTVRTSSQFTLPNQLGQTNPGLQAIQSLTAARPIQSSLFDTSDLDPMKSPQNQRPVLNVPVVSRLTNKSPFSKSPPIKATPEGAAVVTSGSPLDLSKTTPNGSPVPQTVQAANPAQVQISSAGINTDVFQVFNLRPSTQMQLPRQQLPVQQMIAQQIMLPQQVRQNTPSTLAYRPTGPQMISTSQVQQIIGMPVGTAVIGNMVVSLGNVPQGVPPIPVVTQIPTLQNAQFVRMPSPQMQVSAVSGVNSSQSSPVAIQAPPKTTGPVQQVLSKNMLFKCPYCPNLTPLRFDQVQPHIENKHPGSSILFKPYDSR